MRIEDIIQGSGVLEVHGNAGAEVSSVSCDSRRVAAGAMFIAVKGFASDGHDYISQAIEKGAAAIVYEDEPPMQEGVCYIKVTSSRHALAIIAANFYDNPSRKLSLIGITGTNGKTTTVTLLYNLFMGLGYSCGLLSTIANYVGTRMIETTNTTSDPLTINSLMAEMVDAGCEYCFMEVSSIGLEQERTAGLKFRAGIFSNLTHDHLDYHKTFAEYLRCKKLFFDGLGRDSYAITNIDDKNGLVMTQNTRAHIVTYSCRSLADHCCRIVEESVDGMQLRIDGREIWTRLIGRHNAYNLLAAYTAAVICGAGEDEALVALSSLEAAKGRMETLRGPKNISAVIDYCHTPDAMVNALKTLREVAPKQTLICLFGCGGDRDRTKRPEMAEVAEKYSDRVVVTSDNNRSEDIEDIMADIRKGFSPQGQAKALFIADRKEAIRTALLTAPAGAVVLLAGKGHETYQIIGKEYRHLDEREVVQDTFRTMEKI